MIFSRAFFHAYQTELFNDRLYSPCLCETTFLGRGNLELREKPFLVLILLNCHWGNYEEKNENYVLT